MNKAKVSSFANSWPYFYYAKVNLLQNSEQALFFIENGLYYWLKRIAVVYPDAGILGPSPQIDLALYFGERDLPLQDDPIPFNLLCTPGQVRKIPAGIQAGTRKNLYEFNYLYVNSGIIKAVITGQSGGNPSEVKIMVEGMKYRSGGTV